MSEVAKPPSESAGEGVAVTGVRVSKIVSVTQSPTTYEGESPQRRDGRRVVARVAPGGLSPTAKKG